MKKDLIKCIVVKPYRQPEIVEMKNELLNFQRIVDGYIEPVFIGNNLVALVNEDGIRLGMTPNFGIGYSILLGPAVIVADNGKEEYESLTRKQMDEAEQIINEGRGKFNSALEDYGVKGKYKKYETDGTKTTNN